MKKLLLIIIVLSLMAGSAFAYNLNYQFTLAGSSAAISQAQIGGIGSTLNISIWIKSDVQQIASVATLYGWDKSTTFGTAAVKIDNKLTGSTASNIASGWETLPANLIEGGKATTGTRLYGTYVAGGRATGTSTTLPDWTRLFDITLTNAALAAGESYLTKLWDNPGTNGPGGETYIADFLGAKYSPSAVPTLNIYRAAGTPPPVPEPGTLAAMGSCLVGFVSFLRKKK